MDRVSVRQSDGWFVQYLSTPPQTNECSLKKGPFRKEGSLPTTVFRGHVSFRGSKHVLLGQTVGERHKECQTNRCLPFINPTPCVFLKKTHESLAGVPLKMKVWATYIYIDLFCYSSLCSTILKQIQVHKQDATMLFAVHFMALKGILFCVSFYK